MKIKISFVIFFITSPSFAQLITYQGKNYFLNGANVPWNQFGTDVGTHYQWGALYNAQWFENTFTDCENYGINSVRLWIHCDGRSSPEFDPSGYVTGLDANFFSNLDDILLKAKNHNIMVMPCLWSFDMTENHTAGAGMYAGLHADLITDTSKTNSYINNVLIPMVQRYANTCNLLAWEIINEPEWSMTINGGGNTFQTVTASEMQRFVGMQAKAIHQNSNKMVTVGSASLKWNSDIYSINTPCIANFWSDQKIQTAYNHSQAYLDFYQIHYYSWMHSPWIFDPINLSYPYNYWSLDKPAIIGEIGAIDPDYSPSTILSNAYANNIGGLMFWSIKGGGGIGSFNDFKNQSLSFRNNHNTIVDFDCNANSIDNNVNLNCIVYPTITANVVYIKNISANSDVCIFDAMGKIVFQKKITNSNCEINTEQFINGMYYLTITSKEIIFSKIIIKQ